MPPSRSSLERTAGLSPDGSSTTWSVFSASSVRKRTTVTFRLRSVPLSALEGDGTLLRKRQGSGTIPRSSGARSTSVAFRLGSIALSTQARRLSSRKRAPRKGSGRRSCGVSLIAWWFPAWSVQDTLVWFFGVRGRYRSPRHGCRGGVVRGDKLRLASYVYSVSLPKLS